MEQSVALHAVTPNAEKTMVYIARVSNPKGQDPTRGPERLIRYCIRHGHWSVFEHAYMTVEINTTRGISAQLARHRSFTFQEFSQRYADVSLLGFAVPPALRAQDPTNRQNSLDTLDVGVVSALTDKVRVHLDRTRELYEDLLAAGVAKECARFVLPLATPTRLYMTGNCRSWIHFIQLRMSSGTQREHQDVAEKVRAVFSETFPAVAAALEWLRQKGVEEKVPWDGTENERVPCNVAENPAVDPA